MVSERQKLLQQPSCLSIQIGCCIFDANKVILKASLGVVSLLGVVSWGEYVGMDEATSTTDIASDDWEVDLIARARGDQVEEDDSSGDEVSDKTTLFMTFYLGAGM